MGNLPWIAVMLVPSLSFFFYLVYANLRSSRKRKALGLPPLELTPPELRNRRRNNATDVVDDHQHQGNIKSDQ
ncbi:hypothetical protein [Arthrobacter bambusae]|uniref:Cardiolipin synthase N-terminal domain-containing protein n=1 Tax=Arthrobacter bambusae TaxID=1338426 RepID=A0AAW8DKA3_9MICC|nr:hypothetical protein [Arthrobacter bambusae]MDP9905418.1 hypothetical protein [Arthrobacter bambusae]MDQ0129104.1 hypothetical protein [Arthrobacter bambusae]MDQ0180550.1 hypothetical protein [Arthrobacter bambusae]